MATTEKTTTTTTKTFDADGNLTSETTETVVERDGAVEQHNHFHYHHGVGCCCSSCRPVQPYMPPIYTIASGVQSHTTGYLQTINASNAVDN